MYFLLDTAGDVSAYLWRCHIEVLSGVLLRASLFAAVLDKYLLLRKILNAKIYFRLVEGHTFVAAAGSRVLRGRDRALLLREDDALLAAGTAAHIALVS